MNALSSNSSKEVEEEIDFADTLLFYEFVLLAAALTIVCIIAIGGNLLVMLSFILNKNLRTLNNYFLLSLAISDLMIATFSMPLFTAYLLIGEWPFGWIICDMWLAQDYMCSNASGLNLLMIGFDRYFSVKSPLRYRARRTGKHVAAMIGCVWVLSFLVWPPWIYSYQYIEGKRTVPEDECYVQFIHANSYLAVITAVIAYYIPVSILCILYYKVWRETVKRKRYLSSMKADNETKTDLQETSSHFTNLRLKLFSCCSLRHCTSKKPCVQETVETVELFALTSSPLRTPAEIVSPDKLNECDANVNQNQTDVQNVTTNRQVVLDSDSLKEKLRVNENIPLRTSSVNRSSTKHDNKAARVLTAIVLAFIITATPYNIVAIVKSFNPFLVSDAVWFFSYFMFYVNSALDPLCYALANENFRKTYWRILKCSWGLKSRGTSSLNSSFETKPQSKTSKC